MMTTTINGKAITDTSTLHRLWANHLELCERFETGRPIASTSTREKLKALSTQLEGELSTVWENRKQDAFAAKVAMNRYVRLEEELGSMAADAPIRENFYVRTVGWVYDPEADRLEGDEYDLAASAAEAEADAKKLRFELHRIRKSTANRVALCKAGLVARFNWGQAWAQTKERMRELGAEIRQHENWVRAVERELMLREREHEAEYNRGVVECEDGYELPELQPYWGVRDYAEMAR